MADRYPRLIRRDAHVLPDPTGVDSDVSTELDTGESRPVCRLLTAEEKEAVIANANSSYVPLLFDEHLRVNVDTLELNADGVVKSEGRHALYTLNADGVAIPTGETRRYVRVVLPRALLESSFDCH